MSERAATRDWKINDIIKLEISIIQMRESRYEIGESMRGFLISSFRLSFHIANFHATRGETRTVILSSTADP